MSSKLGTPLPRRKPAWFWVAAAVIPAICLALRGSGTPAAILGLVSMFFAISPWLGRREHETVQVDETGVLRVDGDLKEQVTWGSIEEIRIITTDKGPFQEDVFFVLGSSDGKGCLVPHDAAVRTKLLEELQARFVGLDDKMVIKAMGTTSNNNFLIWKKASAAA